MLIKNIKSDSGVVFFLSEENLKLTNINPCADASADYRAKGRISHFIPRNFKHLEFKKQVLLFCIKIITMLKF